MAYQLSADQSSIQLHLNSKDANYYVGQTLNGIPQTGSFVFLMDQYIACDPDVEITISVEQCEIPFSFYNVSHAINNNKFHFQETGHSQVLLTLSEGNYDAENLATDLSSMMTTNSNIGATYTVTYSERTNKLTFTSSSATVFKLEFINHIHTGSLLGFLPAEYSSSSNSITSETVVNVNSIPFIFVDSSFGNQGAITSVTNSGASILTKIQNNEPWNSMIFFANQNSSGTAMILRRKRISSIRLTLRDPYFNVVDLNGKNWSITLTFNFIDPYATSNVPTNYIGSTQDENGVKQFMRPLTIESLNPKLLEWQRSQAKQYRQIELKKEKIAKMIASGKFRN